LLVPVNVTVYDPGVAYTWTGVCKVDVPPSPKFHTKPTRLPDAIAVEVDGEKVVPFTSHSGAAEKLRMGGGKMPSEFVRVAVHPILLVAINTTE